MPIILIFWITFCDWSVTFKAYKIFIVILLMQFLRIKSKPTTEKSLLFFFFFKFLHELFLELINLISSLSIIFNRWDACHANKHKLRFHELSFRRIYVAKPDVFQPLFPIILILLCFNKALDCTEHDLRAEVYWTSINSY